MKSQVAPIADARQHRVGDSADTNLNGGAIVDIAADVARDRLFNRAQRLCPDLDRRARSADDKIDTRQVHTAVAPSPRHLLFDLGDNHARPLHRGLLKIVTKRKAVFAALVGFAELNEDHVGRENALFEIAGNVREVTRHDLQ